MEKEVIVEIFKEVNGGLYLMTSIWLPFENMEIFYEKVTQVQVSPKHMILKYHWVNYHSVNNNPRTLKEMSEKMRELIKEEHGYELAYNTFIETPHDFIEEMGYRNRITHIRQDIYDVHQLIDTAVMIETELEKRAPGYKLSIALEELNR